MQCRRHRGRRQAVVERRAERRADGKKEAFASRASGRRPLKGRQGRVGEARTWRRGGSLKSRRYSNRRRSQWRVVSVRYQDEQRRQGGRLSSKLPPSAAPTVALAEVGKEGRIGRRGRAGVVGGVGKRAAERSSNGRWGLNGSVRVEWGRLPGHQELQRAVVACLALRALACASMRVCVSNQSQLGPSIARPLLPSLRPRDCGDGHGTVYPFLRGHRSKHRPIDG